MPDDASRGRTLLELGEPAGWLNLASAYGQEDDVSQLPDLCAPRLVRVLPVVANDIQLRNDRVIVTCERGSELVWSLRNGVVLAEAPVSGSFEYSDESKRVVTFGEDHQFKLWDTIKQQLVCSGSGADLGVKEPAFSANGRRFCVVRADDGFDLRESKTGALLHSYTGKRPVWVDEMHLTCVRGDKLWLLGPTTETELSVPFEPYSTRACSGGFAVYGDGKLSQLWSAEGKPTTGVLSADWGPAVWEDNVVCAGSNKPLCDEGPLRITTHAGLPVAKLGSNFRSAEFSPDGQWLVGVGWNWCQLFRTPAFQPGPLLVERNGAGLGPFVFSPDSRYLAVGSGKALRVYDLQPHPSATDHFWLRVKLWTGLKNGLNGPEDLTVAEYRALLKDWKEQTGRDWMDD